MISRDVTLLAVGAGPSSLGLAVALEELAPDLARDSLLLERERTAAWQRGTLMPWAQSQVSFLKDLVLMRNPRSRFSFLNYLHSVGRLVQFVNLATFTPYRVEISNYLNWVAESLESVQIDYGQAVQRIEPERDRTGTLTGWRTVLENGSSIRSSILVVCTGRDPWIPPVFRSLPAERVVHSTTYLQRIRDHSGNSRNGHAPQVVVVGGAQSSAEMLAAVMSDLPDCQATLVTRSVGFVNYQTSKFTNELYFPSFVDEFYQATASAQEQMLREMHQTNYGGLAPDLLESLYRRVYLERLSGASRISLRTMTDVVEGCMEGEEVVLTLFDRKTGASQDVSCDLVLLGTGFDRKMPALVRDLALRLGLSRIQVSRNYRLVVDFPATAACYLQGVNEATHGIADSLLSVVAVRSAETVTDILAFREEARATSAKTAQAVSLAGT